MENAIVNVCKKKGAKGTGPSKIEFVKERDGMMVRLRYHPARKYWFSPAKLLEALLQDTNFPGNGFMFRVLKDTVSVDFLPALWDHTEVIVRKDELIEALKSMKFDEVV